MCRRRAPEQGGGPRTGRSLVRVARGAPGPQRPRSSPGHPASRRPPSRPRLPAPLHPAEADGWGGRASRLQLGCGVSSPRAKAALSASLASTSKSSASAFFGPAWSQERTLVAPLNYFLRTPWVRNITVPSFVRFGGGTGWAPNHFRLPGTEGHPGTRHSQG